MAENFNAYAKYYDLLYKDKNYQSECEYVSRLIKKFQPNAHSVLELGSGSGTHASFLSNEFPEILGIERSEEMVEISKQKNIGGFTAQIGDITHFQTQKKYDAAISLFHVISYLNKNEQLIACFKNVNSSLNEGGTFLFDVWYTPCVLHLRPETRVKRLENDEISITRIAESIVHDRINVVDVQFEVHIQNKKDGSTQVLTETHPMRHFSTPEIKLLAELTGFDYIHSEEFLSGRQESNQTWGVCYVLKKK